VADSPGLDHPLLSVGERDERAELDDLLLSEVLAEPRPERVVDTLRVPDEVAREEERGLLLLGERFRALELEQLALVRLVQLVSRPERPLRASVLAADRLRDVDATELLQRVVDDPLPEDAFPRPHERLRDGGHVEADGLCLGPRRAVQTRVLHVSRELGVRDGRGVDVADSCHKRSVSK
jgi:hypothetical protein